MNWWVFVKCEPKSSQLKEPKTSTTSVVRVLLCVSCVPASCVHIWVVSCPCFMSLLVKYVPAVFVSLCVNYPVYLVPVFWVWFGLVYSLLPGVSCLSALSCPAWMCWLKTIIWVYILVCVFLFLPRVCTVTSVCVHWIYLIHEFHNLSWITEINELFHDILIYWDAPVNMKYQRNVIL